MTRGGVAAALALAWAVGGCRPQEAGTQVGRDTAVLAARAARISAAKAQPDSGAAHDKPVARWVLPSSLREISGLALTPDGRLFTHGDEDGVVTELDYRRGVEVKRFALGKPTVKADFEGIAVAGDLMYLLSSRGKLYEFQEGKNGTHIDFVVRDTHLGRECEFEGIAFDSATKSLLFACKQVYNKRFRDFMLVFRWSLEKGDGSRLTRLKVPLKDVIGTHNWRTVHPSDITVDPLSGNYVLVASKERAIIEITPTGQLVFVRELPGTHPQPEGVAITRDSLLLVSDEAWWQSPAVITVYRWP